jgi:hypothetical protein
MEERVGERRHANEAARPGRTRPLEMKITEV